MSHLQSVLDRSFEFSNRKFGDRPYTAPLHKMQDDELDELIENPSFEEYADNFILLLDSYRKKYGQDATAERLLNAIDAKLDVLESRVWGEPDENQTYQHVSEQAQAHEKFPQMPFRVEAQLILRELSDNGMEPFEADVAIEFIVNEDAVAEYPGKSLKDITQIAADMSYKGKGYEGIIANEVIVKSIKILPVEDEHVHEPGAAESTDDAGL